MESEEVKSELKKFLRWGSWVLIVLGLFLAFEALVAFKEWRQDFPASSTISVNGEGEVVTIPDIATFSFSVSTDAKNVSDAQKNSKTKIDAILEDLKKQGIEDKDIKTIEYSVWPKYSYETVDCLPNRICPPGRQITDGYTVTQSIQVKIRKTEEAGEALAIAGAKGATNISGLNFTTDDPDKAMTEAKAKAIDDANEKAEALAKNLGVRIVKVVGFYDNAPQPYAGYGGVFNSRDAAMTKSSVGPEMAPSLPQGENKVIANVSVTYEIK